MLAVFLVAFALGFYTLFRGSAPPLGDDECDGVVAAMGSSPWSDLRLLFSLVLSAEDVPISCLGGTEAGTLAMAGLYAYVLGSVVLLLNMLIAMVSERLRTTRTRALISRSPGTCFASALPPVRDGRLHRWPRRSRQTARRTT